MLHFLQSSDIGKFVILFRLR